MNIRKKAVIGFILASIGVLCPIQAMEQTNESFACERKRLANKNKLHRKSPLKIDLHPVYNIDSRSYLLEYLSKLQEKIYRSELQTNQVRIITGTGKKRPGPNYRLKTKVLKFLRTDPSFREFIDINTIIAKGTRGYILVRLIEKRHITYDKITQTTIRPAKICPNYSLAEMDCLGLDLDKPKYSVAEKDSIEICNPQDTSNEDNITSQYCLAEMDSLGLDLDKSKYSAARKDSIEICNSQDAPNEDNITLQYDLAEMDYYVHGLGEINYLISRKNISKINDSQSASDEHKIAADSFLEEPSPLAYSNDSMCIIS